MINNGEPFPSANIRGPTFVILGRRKEPVVPVLLGHLDLSVDYGVVCGMEGCAFSICSVYHNIICTSAG